MISQSHVTSRVSELQGYCCPTPYSPRRLYSTQLHRDSRGLLEAARLMEHPNACTAEWLRKDLKREWMFVRYILCRVQRTRFWDFLRTTNVVAKCPADNRSQTVSWRRDRARRYFRLLRGLNGSRWHCRDTQTDIRRQVDPRSSSGSIGSLLPIRAVGDDGTSRGADTMLMLIPLYFPPRARQHSLLARH